MNAALIVPAPGDAQDEALKLALIRICKLGALEIDEIAAAQVRHHLSFAEAGLQLGYLRPEDVAAATAPATAQRVATVEAARLKPSAELTILSRGFDARTECIRSLRAQLLLRQANTAQANVVAVMSPCAGEGRSLLAAELAVAFAQLGQPTLLVDADLRRPRQDRLFTGIVERGLSEALAGASRPDVHPVEALPPLSVITAGAVPTQPVELLSDRRFALLMQQWRRGYRHVIIDTAPLAEYSDGLAVASLAGRVLCVSRAQHTPYKAMREMLRRLAATQADIVGAVIHHF